MPLHSPFDNVLPMPSICKDILSSPLFEAICRRRPTYCLYTSGKFVVLAGPFLAGCFVVRLEPRCFVAGKTGQRPLVSRRPDSTFVLMTEHRFLHTGFGIRMPISPTATPQQNSNSIGFRLHCIWVTDIF